MAKLCTVLDKAIASLAKTFWSTRHTIVPRASPTNAADALGILVLELGLPLAKPPVKRGVQRYHFQRVQRSLWPPAVVHLWKQLPSKHRGWKRRPHMLRSFDVVALVLCQKVKCWLKGHH